MKEKFEYIVHISLNPFKTKSFESLPTFLDYGALKSSKEEMINLLNSFIIISFTSIMSFMRMT